MSYPGQQDYPQPEHPQRGYPQPGYPPAARPRRRHPLRITLIALIVLAGLLVAADFGARALAERDLADQIQQHGFPKKPDVAIQGFPFLTQVAARDLRQVDISSSDIREGPVTVASVRAELYGVHIDSSLHGGTISRLNGTVLIGFPEISHALAKEAGPLGSALGGSGMTITKAGPHSVRASARLLVLSFTATWRITLQPGDVIDAQLTSSSGGISQFLGSVASIHIPLPKLPLGLTARSISVTSGGLTGQLSGQNVPFSN